MLFSAGSRFWDNNRATENSNFKINAIRLSRYGSPARRPGRELIREQEVNPGIPAHG